MKDKKNILFIARTVFINPFSETIVLKLKRLSSEFNCFFFALNKKDFYKRYRFFCDFYLTKDISWFFFNLFGLFLVPYIIKKKRIESIIFQSPYELPLILFSRMLFSNKIKIIVEMHGDMTNGLRFYGKSFLKCFVAKSFIGISLRFADKIRLVSPYQFEKCDKLKKYKDKIEIFPAFMNLDYFISKRVKDKEYDIIFAGQLEKIKNVELIIDVISEFKSEHKDINLVIVGDGTLKENLKSYARSKGVFNNIIFTGKLKHRDLREHYKKSKVLVLPSLYEGFGRVVCEAAACKIDVLFSQNCGVRSYFPKKSCFKDINELKESLSDILFEDKHESIDYNIDKFIDDKHFFDGMRNLIE